MKIIHICQISTKGGGIESVVENLLMSLQKSGYQTELIGFKPLTSSISTDTYIEITKTNNRWIYLLKLWVVAPFLKIKPEDIIHGHRLDDMLPFVLFHRLNHKVCSLHGVTLKSVQIKNSKIVATFYELVEKIALKRLYHQKSLLIAVDVKTKNHYEARYPWLKGKICVIPVGIDTSRFLPLDKRKMRLKYNMKQDSHIVIYVGRLEKEKNLGFLIRTFELVKKRIINAELILVGDGRERTSLEKMVHDLHLSAAVRFMGSKKYSEIPEILNCADVLALCSQFEGSPNVVKEAIACGIPVVSTDVGDVSLTVSDEHLGKVVIENELCFANAIIYYLLKEDRDRMAIVESSKKYSVKQMAFATLNVYEHFADK